MSDRWQALRELAKAEPQSDRASITASGFIALQTDVRDLLAERDQLLAALRELVECKRLKDAFESFEHTRECLDAPLHACPAYKMEQEYRRRKPLAWAAAERLAGDKTE